MTESFTEAADRSRLRRLATHELTPDEVRMIRELLFDAFGTEEDERFEEHDWQHAMGGLHFVLEVEGNVLTHASVVERELHLGGRQVRTGYVEAVATARGHQGKGWGTLVMREVGSYIRDRFEMGALGTGSQGFYERLGWTTWLGPSSVRTDTGVLLTPGDDGYIMVLATPRSPTLDPTASISCEWRPGDVW